MGGVIGPAEKEKINRGQGKKRKREGIKAREKTRRKRID